jgi:signal transduction histidine kinase
MGEDGKTVKLSVWDTGRGMPPEVRESLFTQGAMSRKRGGTGLGTKIVKDVVDAHGGRITVDSEEGVGTTFHMTLPIARVQ